MATPGFPAYVATATLARSATEAAGPSVLLVAIAVGRPAATGPLLLAALTGAAAVGGPVVGALLDRTPRPRRAFTAAMGWTAVFLAVLSALMASGAATGWLAAVALAAGVSYPAISGAWSAQIPAFVPAQRQPRAYSFDAATYSVAALIGPPLAAAALVIGPAWPLLVPVGLLAAAVLAIRGVPVRGRVGAAPRRSLAADLRSGAAAIVRRPALRRMTVISTLAFGGQAALVVAAPLVSQRLTGGLAFTGAVLAAFAVGGLAVAGVYLRRPVRRPDLTVAVTTLVAGLALLGVGVADQPWVVLAAAAVVGATDAPQLAAMFRVRIREAPEAVRAQVFTTGASLRLTAYAVMSAVLGAMIAAGPAVIVATGAAVHLVGVALGVAVGPRPVGSR